MNTVWLALITGLTTGGISCFAVQGGLLASVITQKKKGDSTFAITSVFLVAKIIAYTILGATLGAIGSKLSITPNLQGWLQIFAGLYMLVTAANLLNLHPIFRYFVIQPPRFAYKFMRKESNKASFFAPVTIGALTVLVPCGITQGMMLLAISSGGALTGAGILFAFTLGTSPIFMAIGMAASQLLKKKAFVYISSIIIVFLGLLSINTGQILRGSPQTFQNYVAVLGINSASTSKTNFSANVNSEGKQEVTINVTSSGYKASANTLKSGVPVKLTFISKNVASCAKSFLIPSLGISKILPENGTDSVEFTPTKTGAITYTCGMGMYTGSFNII